MMPSLEGETSAAQPLQLCHEAASGDSGFLRAAGHFDCLVAWATMTHESGSADEIVRHGSLQNLGHGLRWASWYQA